MALENYITYQEALDKATSLGLISLEVEPIQLPSAENGHYAAVKATAEFENINPATGEFREGKRVFTDVGDASPANTGRNTADALLRMASTRAKGRVLRDGINHGEAIAEEMSDTKEPMSKQTWNDLISAARTLYPQGDGESSHGVEKLEEVINTRRKEAGKPPINIGSMTDVEGQVLLGKLRQQLGGSSE